MPRESEAFEIDMGSRPRSRASPPSRPAPPTSRKSLSSSRETDSDGIALNPSPRGIGTQQWRKGDEVKVNRPGGKFLYGVITRDHGDNTYDIAFDNGKTEDKVKSIRLFPKPPGAASKSSPRKEENKSNRDEPESKSSSRDGYEKKTKLEVGDQVEAKFKGGSKWFPGTIIKVNFGGTFDIRYSDGDEEKRVPAEIIRPVDSKGSTPSRLSSARKTSENSDGGRSDSETFKRGDKVEAKFKGGTKWFTGKVLVANRDGTYDIRYDDGDEEMNVPARNVRAVGGTPKKAAAAADSDTEAEGDRKPRMGDKVEAKFKGGSKWFTGKVLNVNRDGSYDIKYDDGDEERRMPPESVRMVKGAEPSRPSVGRRLNESDKSDRDKSDVESFKRGDKVEAKFKGGTKWFTGKVLVANRDGTYDIRYDDGDEEMNVPARNVRAVGGSVKKAAAADSDTEAEGEKKIRVGDRVEAKFKGTTKWLPGKVLRLGMRGTFDIKFDNGDIEEGVSSMNVRASRTTSSPTKSPRGEDSQTFSRGDRVEAKFKGGARWLPGKVARVNSDGSYDIRYDDGHDEQDVPKRFVRAEGGVSPRKMRSSADSDTEAEGDRKPRMGDKVEAKFKGGSKWFTGKVLNVNRDGSYDIKYDDGDEERRMPPESVRMVKGAEPSRPSVGRRLNESDKSDRDKSDVETFKRGDKVEAKFKGGTKWFTGKVLVANRDGTYDIRYDDGDEEMNVPARNVRAVGGSVKKAAAADSDTEAEGSRVPEAGDKVEARYKGTTKWLPGTVVRVGARGTYEIRYDNGDSEDRVPANYVRLSKSAKSSRGDSSRIDGGRSDSETFKRGDKVEAKFKGGTKWFTGKVLVANRDGTYDIRYDDGDEEMNVPARNVRAVGGTPKKAAAAADSDTEAEGDRKPRMGDKVEAKFKGGSKWFTGKVLNVNRDGSYDIKYDDGDEERRMPPESVRMVKGAEPSRPSGGRRLVEDSEDEGDRKPKLGDKVEAKFKGGTKWFTGKVIKVNIGGTYDIRYDDGDEEKRVPEENVRLVGDSKSKSKSRDEPKTFEKGDKVEAKFKGGTKWFTGKVISANRDGTYDIRYDDGDEERDVPARNVRSVGGDKEPRSDDEGDRKPKLGDKVEAKFKGGTKWFTGKVIKVNIGGTYDIRYDDGDEEKRVPEENVRLVGDSKSKSKSRDEPKTFEKGDKVEAKFKGGTKWFTGKVISANRDGTYDIRYDDGDEERDVVPENVREVGGGTPRKSGGESSPRRPGADGKWRKGDEVKVNRPGGKFLYGVIVRDNGDNTFDIAFDNGKSENNVKSLRLFQKPEGAVSKSSPRKEDSKSPRGDSPEGKSRSRADSEDEGDRKPKLGDKVEAKFKGGTKWFTGKVIKVNIGGTYDIRYDDGDEEKRVPEENVRLVGDSKSKSKSRDEPKTFEKGDKVEAKFKGGTKWFTGKVISANRDGTYDIRYDDGDEERDVPARNVRSVGGDKDSRSDDEGDRKPKLGDKVEAKFKGGTKWFTGKVIKVNIGGTYDIRYDDGDEEKRVPEENVRLVGDSKSKSKSRDEPKTFEKGDKVEAKFKGGTKWFTGKVISANRDGTYDIRYDDGDEERDVVPENVRAVGGDKKAVDSETEKESFIKGDKVEAKFKGGTKWFTGKVILANRDGTYDIRYDDGDEERDVPARNVRSVDRKKKSSESDADSESERPLKKGDKVEARFKGGSRWLTGKVTFVSRDGTYDILYSDGEEERDVPSRYVRALKRGKTDDGSDDDKKSFEKGDKVEAKFKGGSKWFTGKIINVNRDGSYDVRYDDGDEEKRVQVENIRAVKSGADRDSDRDRDRSASPDTRKKSDFEVGDRVDMKVGREWTKGEVERVHRDGLVDVRLDDGSIEKKVDPGDLRSKGKRKEEQKESGEKKYFSKGDKIEAKFRGRDRWFSGEIKKVNRDGTYDILYADGEEEEGVNSRLIRSVDEDEPPKRRKREELPDEKDDEQPSQVLLSIEARRAFQDACRQFQKNSPDSSCRKLFVNIDEKSSGFISKRDFRGVLREILRESKIRKDFEDWVPARDLKMLFECLSQDRSGGSSYDEFLLVAFDMEETRDLQETANSLRDELFQRSKMKVGDMLKQFLKQDVKNKGFVRRGDFERVIRKWSNKLTSRELIWLTDRWDPDNEGVVDYYGFCNWLRAGAEPDKAKAKMKYQLASLDNDFVRTSFERAMNRGDKISKKSFCKICDDLGLVMCQAEIYCVFAALDPRDTGFVSQVDMIDLITVDPSAETKEKKRKQKTTRRLGAVTLLPEDVVQEITQSCRIFARSSDISIWRLLYNTDDEKSGRLSRKQVKAFFSGLGCSLRDSQMNLIFECFEFEGEGGILLEDMALFCMSTINDNDMISAATICRNTFGRKRIVYKEVIKTLLRSDTRNSGFINFDTFEKGLKKLCGSSISGDDISNLARFLDPERDGQLDVGFLASLVMVCADGKRATYKLSHNLRLMRVRDLDYRSVLLSGLEGECLVSEEEFVDRISELGVITVSGELQLIASSMLKKNRVDLKAVLDALEADSTATPVQTDRKSVTASALDRLGGKIPFMDSQANFGKGLFQKICKLRSNDSRRDAFRRFILGKDTDLVGYVLKKDFQKASEGTIDLNEAELGLLVENLSLGGTRGELDYPMFLLSLLEPLENPPYDVSRDIGLKICKDDEENLEKELKKLFNSFAASDRRMAGVVTTELFETIMKDDYEVTDKKIFESIVPMFKEKKSETIFYPELLAFLRFCSAKYVVSRFRTLERIRQKQGYQFTESLIKLSQKKGGKLDKSKVFDVFRSMGILFPDTGLVTLFELHKNTNGNFDAEKFAKSLTTEKPISEKKAERKEMVALDLTKDPVTEKILQEYDKKLVTAVTEAFDLFDVDDKNELPTSDLERILCALGYSPLREEMDSLLNLIDPKDKGWMGFNDYRDNLVKFLRNRYDTSFLQTELEVKELFEYMDADDDDRISPIEFKHIVHKLAPSVTDEEREALNKVLDPDETGSIDWEMFHGIFSFLHNNSMMGTITTEARTALRKLQYCSLPNPERHLQIFAGMPTSFRVSVLADIEKKKKHQLRHLICPKDGNITPPNPPPPVDFQFTIQIIKVTGLPSEVSEHSEDVLHRAVRFGLCRTERPPTGTTSGEVPEFLGNVMKLHGHRHEIHADKWNFTNSEQLDPANSCIVRTSCYPKSRNGSGGEDTNSGPPRDADQLYLFVELITTMRVHSLEGLAKKERRKNARTAVSSSGPAVGEAKKNSSLWDSVRGSVMNKSIDNAQQTEDDRMKAADAKRESRRKEEKEHKAQEVHDGDTDKDKKHESKQNEKVSFTPAGGAEDDENARLDDYLDPTEMCVGWVMIPIAAHLQKVAEESKGGQAKPVTLPVFGGTPFSNTAIDKKDVNPRKGLWQQLKRVIGYHVKSKIEILMIPDKVDARTQGYIPMNIILPTNTLDSVCLFRKKLIEAQQAPYHMHPGHERWNALPQTWAIATPDPVLSAFPRLIGDPAACRVLLKLLAEKNTGFDETVLKVWEAFTCPDAQPSRLYPFETMDVIYKREMIIRELLNLSNSQTSLQRTAYRAMPPPKTAPAGASRDASGATTSIDPGVAAAPTSTSILSHGRTYAPFNARELMWQERIEYTYVP